MKQDLNYNIGEWVDKGNEINNTLRARLKSEAMKIDYSNDFDNTYYVAHNNIPRSELKQAYTNLRKARNQFHRDEQETLSEYIAQGEILFVDADNEQYFDEIKELVGKRIKSPNRMLPNTETASQQEQEIKLEADHNAEANNIDEENKNRKKEARERKKREAELQAEQERLIEQQYQEEAKRRQEQRRKSNQSKENQRHRKRTVGKIWKILFTVGILLFLLIESDLIWMLKSELKSRSGDKNEEVVTVLEEAPEEASTQVKEKKKEKKQSKEIVRKGTQREKTSEKKKQEINRENKLEERQTNEERNSSSQMTKTEENQSELYEILKELHKQFSKDNGKSRFETNVEYGIEKGMSDVDDLLKRAESLNPKNKEVVAYRKQYNSIMQKHDLL